MGAYAPMSMRGAALESSGGVVQRPEASIVGDVAAPFAISTQAISRHLQVLERAGLIERRVERQWRFVRVRADALEPVESWITRHRQHWTTALDRLEALAAAQTPRRRKS